MTYSTSSAADALAANRRRLMIAGIVAGIVLLIIATIYLTQPASSLPRFFPGYSASATTHTHYKHAIAAGLLGLGGLVLAWLNSGPASTQEE
jgi:hypothetical protein